MKKQVKWTIGGIVAAVVIIAAAWGLYAHHQKVVDIQEHSAPYYAETGKKVVLLSADADKLNDYQEEQFWNLARSVVEHASWSDKTSENFEDDTLFVEKTKDAGWYHLEYVMKSDVLIKMKFKTVVDIKPKTADFRDSSHYRYRHYVSDFDDYNN